MSVTDLHDAAWCKSSRSGSNEGSCVEIAPVWRKSSCSDSNEGSCVEVGVIDRRG